MLVAIKNNEEITFTDDKELLNTKDIAIYEDVLEWLSCYGEELNGFVQVAEGIVLMDDEVGIELVIKIAC